MTKPWEKRAIVKKGSKRKHSFCIFTEGETERLYFNDFPLTNVKVKCVGLGGGGVQNLVKEATRLMKKESAFADFDYYFLVFDHDNNTSDAIKNAIAMAEAKKLQWCYSNPCFELWLLLHFDFHNTATTPTELKKRLLPKKINGYKETMPNIYKLLQANQSQAISFAEKLLENDNWPKRFFSINPCTNVHDLVKKLNLFLTVTV